MQSCQNQRQGRIALPRLDRDDDEGDFDVDADIYTHYDKLCVRLSQKNNDKEVFIALPRLDRDDDDDGDADVIKS